MLGIWYGWVVNNVLLQEPSLGNHPHGRIAVQEVGMNKIVEKYGLKPVSRPKVKLVRELDLSGQKGKEIVRSKTKLVMQVHKKTFAKLADM